MKKAKNQSAGAAKKNNPKQQEVSGHLSKRAAEPLTTVPREENIALTGDQNTTTTVPRE